MTAISETPPDFSRMATRLLPAVVNISSTQNAKNAVPAPMPDIPEFPPDSPFYKFFKDFDAPPSNPQAPLADNTVSLGSGFVVDPKGLIVTNNHVIDGADKITVILQDNTSLPATLVGRDVQTDLALLQVKPAKPLPAVRFGDSDAIRIGDWAIAIGNPYGFGGTMTAGIISAKARAINDGGPYDDFLQTDAAINKGNSGGPLFDLAGNVIGINSAIFSPSGGSAGIGFAIPAQLADHIVGELRRYHHVRRGWIGARVQPVNPDIAQALGLAAPEGAVLGAVVDGSPAAHAGLEPGDVIESVGPRKVTSIRRFRRLVNDLAPGDRTTLGVLRQGASLTLPVTAADAAVNDPQTVATAVVAPPPPPAPVPTTLLGLSVAAQTDALRQRFQLSGENGIVVLAAAIPGHNDGSRIAPGDLIIEASGTELRRPNDFSARIAALKKSGRKSVLLLVDHGGDLRYVTIPLDRG